MYLPKENEVNVSTRLRRRRGEIIRDRDDQRGENGAEGGFKEGMSECWRVKVGYRE